MGVVAPVEVARAAPKAFVGLERGVLGGIDQRQLGDRGRNGELAVHGLLETGLLLRLEERVVVERVLGHVLPQRHVALEGGVPRLQLEMILNHAREKRRSLYRHCFLRVGDGER
jgi:hypothetical protein